MRNELVTTMARSAREAERERLQAERAQQRAAREAESRRRSLERARTADERERKRLYAEARSAEVDALNAKLEEDVAALSELLGGTLAVDDFLDFEALKSKPAQRVFDPGTLAQPEPAPQLASIPPLSFFAKLMPGAAAKHAQSVEQAQSNYNTAVGHHQQREAMRVAALQSSKEQFDAEIQAELDRIAEANKEIDEFKSAFDAGDRDAIAQYFQLVLMSSSYPEGFPQKAKLSYSPDSKQLAVEYDLPAIDAIPPVARYKYVKTKDEVTSTMRPANQIKALYTQVIAQVALRTLHEIFEADRSGKVDTLVLNAHVATVDPGTGQDIHPCLLTVRTTKDAFCAIDLARVEPLACLKTLSASVSKSPAELAPVRPVLDFSMVDPRFIESSDVLSELDSRPNLMELTPNEFENLITNLFEKMGLETRLTQASRDGGVDCVAYNTDPVLGGKVVIQAKRYKHTVGVSAVRDLYGTLQNEGASKGILVTTSGYGKAAYDFAQNKPIELFEGANLLFLLAQYAGMEARIEPPEDWKDPETAQLD